MSSIFGIFHRDASSLDQAALDAMKDAHSSWHPDATGMWSGEGLGLGHCMLWNTPESKSENQPLVADMGDGICVVSADIRLDNRDELAMALEMDADLLAVKSDVDLLMLAWQKWNDDCARHLLGDFAFVVWDGLNQRIFCCRDHMGIRPFYYFLTDDFFAFGSDIRVLLAIKALPRELNPLAVAIYLSEGELVSRDLTFLQAIKKLPSGSSMTVTPEDVSYQTYWRPEDAPPLKFDSVEQCAAELRALLERAVGDRLRSIFPLYSHLSGGLDSSAIATIAARQLAGQDQRLRAFNWIHPPSTGDDPSQFEWSYAENIARREGINLENIDLSYEDILADLEFSDITHGNNVDLWYETKTLQLVKRGQGRVILSGWGGDEFISHAGFAVFGALFWTGCFATALRGLVAEAKLSKRPFRRMARLVLDELLLPRLPASLRKDENPYPDYFKCVRKNFLEFVSKQAIEIYKRPVLSNRKVQLSLFHSGHIQNRVDSWSSAAWAEGVEYRYPLLDVRVVEFALGLAASYYRQEGQDRYIFREACKGLLSEEVRLNRYKDEPTRVDRLLELEFAALRELFQKLEVSQENSLSVRQFVNMDCLKHLMVSIEQQKSNSLMQNIFLAEILLKNVRVLRLGQHLW